MNTNAKTLVLAASIFCSLVLFYVIAKRWQHDYHTQSSIKNKEEVKHPDFALSKSVGKDSKSLQYLGKKTLMREFEIGVITDDSFESEVLQSELPVLVYFWTEWCGPCRMVGPLLEQLAGEYSRKIKIGKVNVDEERQIVSRYGIRSIPTLIIFKGGENIKQMVGALPIDEIRKEIKAVL